ncbi:hypothetical protein [Herbaspirillum sp. meg3]|uniref:hypothetical protein n=1 Tax=Herbaspirillum sp. meg3 TaxID=2025949 RepID=UPI0012FDE248|nr:hypothetical protein [Herbaspirillum sp. meg3]
MLAGSKRQSREQRQAIEPRRHFSGEEIMKYFQKIAYVFATGSILVLTTGMLLVLAVTEPIYPFHG